MAEKFISVREASQILGVSEKTIIDLVNENKIPAYKIGGQYLRLNKEQIESLKNSGFVEAEFIQHKYTKVERIKDFFYFNDFYIVSLIIISVLIYFIISE
ncbi:MAG: helix-turn-helix domain-containing protein [Candidatus Omnitrophota bacterium]|nr:helix-turn-helix domain-containing protein [Candidatus Omnitrophota bacterium]